MPTASRLGAPPSISRNFPEASPQLLESLGGTLGVWLCASRQDPSCFATLRLAKRPGHGSFHQPEAHQTTPTHTQNTHVLKAAQHEREHPVGLWERACMKRKLSKKTQLDCAPRTSPSSVCVSFSLHLFWWATALGRCPWEGALLPVALRVKSLFRRGGQGRKREQLREREVTFGARGVFWF